MGLVLTTGYQNLMTGVSATLLWRAASPLIIIEPVLLVKFIIDLHWEIKGSTELLLHALCVKGVWPFLSTL